jgi:hypothetical protein
MPDKSKFDRVKETVRLLKELQRVGFNPNDSGYKQIETIMKKWVEDGEPASDTVVFMRHQRDAIIELPRSDDKAASIQLKAWPQPEAD